MMKLKMKATMRSLTRKGILLLAKKTKDASRAYEKAFLSPLSAQVAAGNIVAAEKVLPRSEAASEVWEANETTLTVYKDALYLVALDLTKTLAREKEYENFDAADDTQIQLDEVMAQLRQLGDQRDLFVEDDEEEEGDARQLAFASAEGRASPDDED
jgi:hypothetical protein